MDRAKLIRAASREAASILVFSDPGTKGQIRTISDSIAEHIIDAIEPLLRADERREAQLDLEAGIVYRDLIRDDVLADLRAKIKAVDPIEWALAGMDAPRIVLALMDGSDDDKS